MTCPDTIAALASPPGRGGIAVIRVSGPAVSCIMQTMFGRILQPRIATFLRFKDAGNAVLDEGIAIYFQQPHSFTGEDVLELQGHGGPLVVDFILQRLLELGARLARPGEFSERAFLNGKIDLTQAEAIADLINASSKQAAQSAIRSLQGAFSDAITAINEKIIELRMYVEAAIDFTDEDIDFLNDEKMAQRFKRIVDAIDALQAKAQQGSLLREGITAVIAGEPNVGKSSLLNALSGKEIAIVTDIPGTTRDILRDSIVIDGMPLNIIDTAGLRLTEDIIEQKGIDRAHVEIRHADIILYMTDARHSIPELPASWVETGQPIVLLRNKIDLLNDTNALNNHSKYPIIYLSAKTGEGLDSLRSFIRLKMGLSGEEGVFLARRRHLDALARAKEAVFHGGEQLKQRCLELAAEDLRIAQRALGEITGEFTVDDLLGRIFSSFCIGK